MGRDVEKTVIESPAKETGSVAHNAALPHALEALKMLTDWSKWCAAIATGAIAGTGALLDRGGSSHLVIILVCGALGFFLISVFAAAMLLLAAPAIAQRLPPPPPKDVFHMGMWEGNQGWPVYRYTTAQSMGLFLGLICFVAAIVARLLGA